MHDTLDLRLFLPAPYDMVKARRESRSGYVTAGPAPTPLPQRRSSVSSDKARDEEGGDPDLLKEEEEKDRPQQNFWTDPPGYVDDVVWPRYVRDHAWLLAGENGEDLTRIDDEGELIRLAGQGTHVNPDVAGVKVAPGQGRLSMAEVLQWAADEVVGHLVSR